jgi:hypothetical protein
MNVEYPGEIVRKAMSATMGPMKILFLHGTGSTPGDVKASYLIQQGHDVLNPALPDDDFDEAVRIAQAEYDQGHPDVVVGSSRGSAVAMNIDSSDTPLVLLCPAWKRYGIATTAKKTIILHSRADERVPFAESEELVRNSGLPSSALIEVGTEHRLADDESLAMMVEACERAATRNSMSDVPHQIKVTDVDGVAVVCFHDLFRCAFDNDRAHELTQELVAVADQTKWRTVILDFEGREFVPAAIIEFPLVKLHKRLGGNLRLCNVPTMAMDHFRMNRLATLFHIYETREQAVKAGTSHGD